MAKKKKYPRRIDAIKAYLLSLLEKEEKPEETTTGEKSLAEQINFGGKFSDPDEQRAEGGVLVGEDTGKTTQAGRTVYKTPEGEMVSEKSTTFKYKGKWINIPSIVMGEQLEDEELKELLDEGLIEPTSIHDKLEEAEKAAKERSDSLEFNRGGTPMDEQMKMFGEGGLFDEGGQVDEESGNDVPIGGTKEGVRDDIPAMLSEGEFVFPEDVTRYHGLEKLMTLRQEAKMGLKKMEAMGQMGNSEEATIPDDLPFSMDDLLVVVTGEEEAEGKKDDEPIKAQAGTFVPATQQQNNMGITGFQGSVYGQQGLQNPTGTVMPQIPASSIVPTVQAPQVGGYSAPTVLAEQVQQPDFVQDVSDIYKPVKYINPTSGETMMINEYQGNPVSAVPAGFVRYDDYIAGGGKDPSEDDVTGTATGTGVETAQVGGGSSDDEKRENKKLFDTLKTNTERNRVEKYNTILAEGSPDEILNEYKKSKTGQVFSAGLGPLALPTNLLLNREQKKIEDAYIERARLVDGIDEETARKKLKEISMMSSAKDTIGEFGRGIKDTFFKKGGLDKYNSDYDAQFNLEDFTNARGGYNNVNINFNPVQGYVKGSANNNLSSQQQQLFDMAIKDGNMSTAKHFEMVARSNAARNEFARENASLIKAAQRGDETARAELKNKVGNKQYNGIRIGASSVDTIIKYGGSVVTAVDDGRAEAGGTFKSAKVAGNGVGVAGDKGPIKTVVNTKKSNDNNSGGGKSFHEKIQDKAAERRKQAISDVRKTSGSYKTLKETGGGDRGMAKGGLMKGKK